MIETLHDYFAWAGESIYDTTGGEGSALNPGWWNDGAYGSITVARKNPGVLYVHVTSAPKTDNVRVPNNGFAVALVADLRTGSAVKFRDSGVLQIWNRDWSDVTNFGDQVFEVTLAGAPGPSATAAAKH
jgi:RES domain-containing protein